MDPTAPPSYAPSLPSLDAIGGAPIYVTGEEALLLTAWSRGASVTLTLTGRMLIFGQTRPTPFTQTVVVPGNVTTTTVRLPLGDGWLLNAQVVVSSGSPLVGQVFARLSIAHGLTSVAAELWTLCADYITATQSLSYPGSLVTRSTDGGGAVRAVTGTTPGAGVELTEQVPTGVRWELLAFRFLFTSAVAAATRVVSIVMDDGTASLFESAAFSTQLASLALVYTLFPGAGTGASFSGNQIPIAGPINIRLAAGYRIKTQTGNIQGADQYSALRYLVREWIEP